MARYITFSENDDSGVFNSTRVQSWSDDAFESNQISIKDCIFQALPSFSKDVADRIEKIVTDHCTQNFSAIEYIVCHNLSKLEAEAVCWYGFDSSKFFNLQGEPSPLKYFGATLRRGNQKEINCWKDFLYFFINALHKLPREKMKTYRASKYLGDPHPSQIGQVIHFGMNCTRIIVVKNLPFQHLEQ